MHKCNPARVEGRSIPSEFCSIRMGAQAILRHVTMDLQLLSINFESVSLLLCHVQQPPARRLLVLVASNKYGGIGLRDEPRCVPGTWPTCEHSATRNNTCWRASKDALAVALIAYERHVWSRKR